MTWEQIGVVLGALAALTVVHSYTVVPRIILECRKEWRLDLASFHKERQAFYEAMIRRIERLEAITPHAFRRGDAE